MRYRYGKWIGFALGTLLGASLALILSVSDLLFDPSKWAVEARALGPLNGFFWGLSQSLPLAFMLGLLFGIFGFWCGKARDEAPDLANTHIAERVIQAENVWPPPPIKGDTDDT